MTEESMARLGFALWLSDCGVPRQAAAFLAFSREPDVLTAFTGDE